MSDSVDRSNEALLVGSEGTRTGASDTGASALSSSEAGARSNPAAASATMTMTMADPQTQSNTDGVLRLTLTDRPNVTWNEDVIDNEGLGRKSSKRCCIFHKSRKFGESSTDTSDNESDDERKKIAKKKTPGKKKVPDNLRFHA